jgi:hypothetical protein
MIQSFSFAVQHLVERADVALAVVDTLAFGDGVVNE